MITAHVLVKNEARFVWFSVMSVLPFVDRLRIKDTGSTDGTIEIIEHIQKLPQAVNKIVFSKEKMEHFDEEVARAHMLEETETGWFIMVDADEIWWDQSIAKVTEFIRKHGEKYESIVVPTINLVGDMFHYQEPQAGKYKLAGRQGHYNVRGINRSLPGLKSLGMHGTWGWADGNSKMIQDRDPKKIKFIDAPYLHTTHLPRAGNRIYDKQVQKRSFKYKHEIGLSFPLDFYYPEVLFKPRPDNVASPWYNTTTNYKFKAYFYTPLKKIKRRYLPAKVGY